MPPTVGDAEDNRLRRKQSPCGFHRLSLGAGRARATTSLLVTSRHHFLLVLVIRARAELAPTDLAPSRPKTPLSRSSTPEVVREVGSAPARAFGDGVASQTGLGRMCALCTRGASGRWPGGPTSPQQCVPQSLLCFKVGAPSDVLSGARTGVDLTVVPATCHDGCLASRVLAVPLLLLGVRFYRHRYRFGIAGPVCVAAGCSRSVEHRCIEGFTRRVS